MPTIAFKNQLGYFFFVIPYSERLSADKFWFQLQKVKKNKKTTVPPQLTIKHLAEAEL